MREERARLGVHFERIESELSANEQAEVLRGLAQANLLDFLGRHPVAQIHLAPIRQAERDIFTTGRYVFSSEARALLTAAIDSGNIQPITPYANTLADEYFAECFAAYVFHPRLLQQRDPEGYNLAVAARELAGIPR